MGNPVEDRTLLIISVIVIKGMEFVLNVQLISNVHPKLWQIVMIFNVKHVIMMINVYILAQIIFVILESV